jgi:hypothetical protein
MTSIKTKWFMLAAVIVFLACFGLVARYAALLKSDKSEMISSAAQNIG